MDTMFASVPDTSLNRFEDLTMDSKRRLAGAVHHAELTNRDIEAEVLARLARRGHDWTGKRQSQRRNS